MKKALSASPTLLYALHLFFPACEIVDAFVKDFNFVLYRDGSIFSIAIAAISVAIMVLLLALKPSLNRTNTVLLSLVPLLSAINGILMADGYRWPGIPPAFAICWVANFVLLIRYVRPVSLKASMAVLSCFVFAACLVFSTIASFFWNMTEVTQISSLRSPENTYNAILLSSDQGALGGGTYVDVEVIAGQVHLLVGEFRRPLIYVYAGKWGEHNSMQMFWENDDILVINGEKYSITDAKQDS